MDAQLFRSRLESAGINAFVADENMTNINLFLSPVIGGLRVQVLESDAPTAKAILREFEGAATEEEQPIDTSPACPKCQSTNLTSKPKGLFFMAMSVLLFAVGGPLARRNWTCCDCGEKWTR